MKIKIILITFCVLFVAFSCNKKNKATSGASEFESYKVSSDIKTKTSNKNWTPKTPYGMVSIPKGSFQMGQSDQDFTFQANAPIRTVTVSEFFMDEAEITNATYKEFVKYVRDSTVRSMLGEKVDLLGGESGKEGVANYAFQISSKEESELTPYESYIKSQEVDKNMDDLEIKKINWKPAIIWSAKDYPDVEYAEVLESLYFSPQERYNSKRQLDYKKFIYSFSTLDKAGIRLNKDRSKILLRESVPVYPDTTVWIKDFAFSYNDPLHEEYFWHVAYNNYPVVGVTWLQAQAFANYRSIRFQSNSKNKSKREIEFRLPTETEWEYAARGGLENASYPWGGPQLEVNGCFLANFKPKRGDYVEDVKSGNYIYTAKVKSFKPNGYGLYDMAGNVSEWTNTPYYTSSYSVIPSNNPFVQEASDNPRKIIRGGSWKDISYMLMVSSRDYEYKDSARSYIGFRCVQNIPQDANVTNKKGQ
ncbi:MAG: gliding motility lipoprotein GldK [Solirubrobacteraceae bacterium]